MGVDRFFHALYTQHSTRMVMLLGSACSDVTESLAKVVPYWNIVQVRHFCSQEALEERRSSVLILYRHHCRYHSAQHPRHWVIAGNSPCSIGRWHQTRPTIQPASLSSAASAGTPWRLSPRTRRCTPWPSTIWSPNWRRRISPVRPPSPSPRRTSRISSGCCE